MARAYARAKVPGALRRMRARWIAECLCGGAVAGGAFATAAPLIGGDGVHNGRESAALIGEVGVVVDEHAQAMHHGQTTLVRYVGYGDDSLQAECGEAVLQPAGGRFGCVTLAPVLTGQT